MGMAYAIHIHWRQLPLSQSEIQAARQAEHIIVVKRNPTLARRKMNSTLRVLQQSHLVFSESWRLLVGASSNTTSPMKALSVRLAKHMASDAVGILANPTCPQSHDELSSVDVTDATKPFDLTLIHNDCRSGLLPSVAEIKWTNFENPKAPAKMSLWIHPNQVKEGIGESLALLNQTITCEYVVAGDDDKILKMSCQHLGLGLTRAEHYQFHRFEYQADQHDLLTVEADHYQNLMEKIGCVSEQPCLKLQVPLAGRIHVVDNRKMGPRKQTEVVAAVAPPAPMAPPPPSESPNPRPTVGLPGVAGAPPAENPEAAPAVNALNSAPSEVINAAPVNEANIGQEQNNGEIQAKAEVKTEIQSEGGEARSQNQAPQNPSLPGQNPVGPASPDVQPPVNTGGPTDLQSREPSGQEAGAVLLPER